RQRPPLGSRIDEALPRADENDQPGDTGDEEGRVRPDVGPLASGELDVLRIVGVRQAHAGEKSDAERSEEREFGVRCVSTALKAALTRRTPKRSDSLMPRRVILHGGPRDELRPGGQ